MVRGKDMIQRRRGGRVCCLRVRRRLKIFAYVCGVPLLLLSHMCTHPTPQTQVPILPRPGRVLPVLHCGVRVRHPRPKLAARGGVYWAGKNEGD